MKPQIKKAKEVGLFDVWHCGKVVYSNLTWVDANTVVNDIECMMYWSR